MKYFVSSQGQIETEAGYAGEQPVRDRFDIRRKCHVREGFPAKTLTIFSEYSMPEKLNPDFLTKNGLLCMKLSKPVLVFNFFSQTDKFWHCYSS